MPNKKIIEVIPAKTFEIKDGHKYLIIMPKGYVQGGEVGKALEAFFGEKKVLVLAPEDVNKIKIAEVFEE